jgi:hypothetical protein
VSALFECFQHAAKVPLPATVGKILIQNKGKVHAYSIPAAHSFTL